MTEKENLTKWIGRILIVFVIFIVGILIINALFFQHEEGLVCVTHTGECYHSPGCHYLYSVIEKGIEEAKAAGYRACSYCGGVPIGTIVVNNYFASGAIVLLLGMIGFFIYMSKQSNETDNQVSSQSSAQVVVNPYNKNVENDFIKANVEKKFSFSPPCKQDYNEDNMDEKNVEYEEDVLDIDKDLDTKDNEEDIFDNDLHSCCEGIVYFSNTKNIRYKGTIFDGNFVVRKGKEYNSDGTLLYSGLFETEDEYFKRSKDSSIWNDFTLKKNGKFYKNNEVIFSGVPRTIKIGNCASGVNPYSFPYSCYSGILFANKTIENVYFEGKIADVLDSQLKAIQFANIKVNPDSLLEILKIDSNIEIINKSKIDLLDCETGNINKFMIVTNSKHYCPNRESRPGLVDNINKPGYIRHKAGDIIGNSIIVKVVNE